jgi:hypothetical protein
MCDVEADAKLATGCAKKSHVVRARMLPDRSNTFVACCEKASSMDDVHANLLDILQQSKRTIHEIVAALLMVGRYISANETRVREVANASGAREALDNLLDVSTHVVRALKPAVHALSTLSKKNIARVNKTVVMSGVGATPSVFEDMSAMFFDALGVFVHRVQLDVAGFDVTQLPVVDESSMFAWAQRIRRGAARTFSSLYAGLVDLGIISGWSIIATVSFLAVKEWLLPALQGVEALNGYIPTVDPRMKAALQVTKAAVALCAIANNASFYRKLLPLFFKGVLRSYKKYKRGGDKYTSALREQFALFDTLASNNKDSARVLNALKNFEGVVNELKQQSRRIAKGEGVAADNVTFDTSETLAALLDAVEANIFNAQWFTHVLQPVCTAVSLAYQPSLYGADTYAGHGWYGSLLGFGPTPEELATLSQIEYGIRNLDIHIPFDDDNNTLAYLYKESVAEIVKASLSSINSNKWRMLVPHVKTMTAYMMERLTSGLPPSQLRRDMYSTGPDAVGLGKTSLPPKEWWGEGMRDVRNLWRYASEHSPVGNNNGISFYRMDSAYDELFDATAVPTETLLTPPHAWKYYSDELTNAQKAQDADAARLQAITAANVVEENTRAEAVKRAKAEAARVKAQLDAEAKTPKASAGKPAAGESTADKPNTDEPTKEVPSGREASDVLKDVMWWVLVVFAAYAAVTEASTNTTEVLSNDVAQRVRSVDPKRAQRARDAFALSKRVVPTLVVQQRRSK